MKSFLLAILITMLSPALLADAFTIHNDGKHTVENIYQTPISSTSWGSDWLFGVLSPNQVWKSPLSDFCIYNIEIVYFDANTSTVNNFDTCNNDLYLHY